MEVEVIKTNFLGWRFEKGEWGGSFHATLRCGTNEERGVFTTRLEDKNIHVQTHHRPNKAAIAMNDDDFARAVSQTKEIQEHFKAVHLLVEEIKAAAIDPSNLDISILEESDSVRNAEILFSIKGYRVLFCMHLWWGESFGIARSQLGAQPICRSFDTSGRVADHYFDREKIKLIFKILCQKSKHRLRFALIKKKKL